MWVLRIVIALSLIALLDVVFTRLAKAFSIWAGLQLLYLPLARIQA